MTRGASALFLSFVLVVAPFSPVLAVGKASVAANAKPHRAVYELKLVDGGEPSGIVDVTGRMVTEWNGSPCEGYTVDQRVITEMTDASGLLTVSDIRITSWEAAEGDTFRFVFQHYVNGDLSERLEGEARRTEGGGEVVFDEPADAHIDLPANVVFPTELMFLALEGAMEGEQLITRPLYDGSDVEKWFETSVFTGEPAEAGTAGPGIEAEETVYPVTVAYFDPERQDGLPDYQVGFDLAVSTVTRDLVMNYGDFVLEGELAKVDFLPEPDC